VRDPGGFGKNQGHCREKAEGLENDKWVKAEKVLENWFFISVKVLPW
jgi:hypothetical protein